MRKIRNAYGVLVKIPPQGLRLLNNISDGVVWYKGRLKSDGMARFLEHRTMELCVLKVGNIFSTLLIVQKILCHTVCSLLPNEIKCNIVWCLPVLLMLQWRLQWAAVHHVKSHVEWHTLRNGDSQLRFQHVWTLKPKRPKCDSEACPIYSASTLPTLHNVPIQLLP
jgi:hypothetical protein